MRNIKALKPKTFVTERQLRRHVSTTMGEIMDQFVDFGYNNLPGGGKPVWRTLEWLEEFEHFNREYIISTDKTKKELKKLRYYLVHEAEFDYIVVEE